MAGSPLSCYHSVGVIALWQEMMASTEPFICSAAFIRQGHRAPLSLHIRLAGPAWCPSYNFAATSPMLLCSPSRRSFCYGVFSFTPSSHLRARLYRGVWVAVVLQKKWVLWWAWEISWEEGLGCLCVYVRKWHSLGYQSNYVNCTCVCWDFCRSIWEKVKGKEKQENTCSRNRGLQMSGKAIKTNIGGRIWLSEEF